MKTEQLVKDKIKYLNKNRKCKENSKDFIMQSTLQTAIEELEWVLRK